MIEARFSSVLQNLYVGLNSRGATGDTLVQLEGPSDAPASFMLCQYGEGYLRGFTIPFASGFTQHPGPGGVIYSAYQGDYSIAVTRNGGADTVRVIRRPLPAEPVGDDEWEEGNRDFNEWRAENRSASMRPFGPHPTRRETDPRGTPHRARRKALGHGDARGRGSLGGLRRRRPAPRQRSPALPTSEASPRPSDACRPPADDPPGQPRPGPRGCLAAGAGGLSGRGGSQAPSGRPTPRRSPSPDQPVAPPKLPDRRKRITASAVWRLFMIR